MIVELFQEQIKIWHGTQLRKYTNVPYWTHPVEVKNILKERGYNEIALLIALGHDLLEDTEATTKDICNFLTNLGHYSASAYQAYLVCKGIEHLTDFFTVENFPTYNRKIRKELEAKRIGEIPSNTIKTIKLVDMYCNSISIKEHAPKFWETYKIEKQFLLDEISIFCDSEIRKMCESVLQS